MKILISADIEGASGVVSYREIGYPHKPTGDPEATPDYLEARKLLTGDINAAVEGAIEAGAEHFVLHDSHGMGYRNVIYKEIHSAVEVIRGMPIIFYDEGCLDNSYDAAFMIAMHGRGGQPAVLSHVLDWPLLREVRINGQPVGEAHLTVELAGYFGIPTVLISGDDKVCEEVTTWTRGKIKTAIVKYALSRYAARCLSIQMARERIHQAARAAVQKVREYPLTYFEKPYTIEVDFLDRQIATYVSWMPEIQYDGNYTIAYTTNDFLDVYHTLLAMFWIASSKLNP